MTAPAVLLTAVLDGRVVPGLHRWASALDAAYVEGAVRRAGRRFGHLAGADSAAAFHTAIAAALGFPSYYGRNLDALHDCVSDLADEAVDTGGPAVLLWDEWEVLAEAEPRVFRIATEILAGSVVTLLRGPEPDDLV